MESQELIVQTTTMDETGKDSYLKALVDLFFAPSKAFAAIRVKPRWFLPFVICVMAVLTNAALTSHYRMEDIKQRLRSDPTLTVEEVQRRLDNIEAQQTKGVSWQALGKGLVYSTVFHAVKLFGLAFVIWLALQLCPTKAGFKSILSACSFTFLVLVPEALLKIPLVITKGTTNVYLGLAALLPRQWDGSPLFNLSKKLDIFSVWMVILLIVALPIVVGITKRRAYATVGYLWGIWLLISMFFSNLIQIT